MIALIFGVIVKRAIQLFDLLRGLKPSTLAIIALIAVAAYQYWSHGRYARKAETQIAKLDATVSRETAAHEITRQSLKGCRGSLDSQNDAITALGEATKQGQKRAQDALQARDAARRQSEALQGRIAAVVPSGGCVTPKEVYDAKL